MNLPGAVPDSPACGAPFTASLSNQPGQQEAWFLARASQAAVPVPEVLWLGAVDTTAGPRTVMVQTSVAGYGPARERPGKSWHDHQEYR